MKQGIGEAEIVDLIVQAAPFGVPRRLQVRRSQIVDGRFKLVHGEWYEHFELVAAEAALPAVFRWTRRTPVAGG
ncbi:DUF5988 family protein [Amycolatopsis sp. NPDC049688]|uniref:DUF5988 family protein n=1 Tax=Amycolatopsis sp. NPDC049688 TaxID=3154733 RepID=UPI00341719A2